MGWIASAAAALLALGAVADITVSLHVWLVWEGGSVSAADYLGELLERAAAGLQGLDGVLQYGPVRTLLDVPAQIYFPVRALGLAILALLTMVIARVLRHRP